MKSIQFFINCKFYTLVILTLILYLLIKPNSVQSQITKKECFLFAQKVDTLFRKTNPNPNIIFPDDDKYRHYSKPKNDQVPIGFYNYTPYYIKVYLNKHYLLTLLPYVDGYFYPKHEKSVIVYGISTNGTTEWILNDSSGCMKYYFKPK